MIGEIVTTTETFKDIPVRIIQTDKDRLMPLKDLAVASGLEREALRKLLNRNKELLAPYTCSVISEEQGQRREITCLTWDGVNGLLMKSNYQRITDPVRRQRVIDFQAWAIKTLRQAMEGKLRIPNEDLMSILNCNMQIAKIVSEQVPGIHPQILYKLAISKTEDLTGEDLTWVKSALPANRNLISGVLTPTQIGKKIGKSAQWVNKTLLDMGYQKAIGDNLYQITISGSMYGEMLSVEIERGKVKELVWRPRWDPGIVEKIENYRPGLIEGQKGLLTGYLS